MATSSKNSNKKLNLSKIEVNRIENALKDKEFVKLLGEYANELRDPENRKRYEEEIAQMEEERGNSVVFINPKPGYVLKTKEQSREAVKNTGSSMVYSLFSSSTKRRH